MVKDVLKEHTNGFMEFVRERGVVGVALGLVLAGVVTKVVTSLLQDIINPLLGLFLGSTKGLANVSFTIFGATINIGHFIAVLIDAFVVMLVVYILVKVLRLDQLDKKK